MEQISILKDKKVSPDDLTSSDWERTSHTQNSTHKDSGGKKVRVTIDIINVYWDGGKNGRRAKILSILYEREG